MNENIDIDTTFVPDDSASHSWTERDSELVEEYAAQLNVGDASSGNSGRGVLPFFHSAGPKRLRRVRSHMCDYAFQP